MFYRQQQLCGLFAICLSSSSFCFCILSFLCILFFASAFSLCLRCQKITIRCLSVCLFMICSRAICNLSQTPTPRPRLCQRLREILLVDFFYICIQLAAYSVIFFRRFFFFFWHCPWNVWHDFWDCARKFNKRKKMRKLCRWRWVLGIVKQLVGFWQPPPSTPNLQPDQRSINFGKQQENGIAKKTK